MPLVVTHLDYVTFMSVGAGGGGGGIGFSTARLDDACNTGVVGIGCFHSSCRYSV